MAVSIPNAELNKEIEFRLHGSLKARWPADYKQMSVSFSRNCDRATLETIYGYPHSIESLWENRNGEPWQSAIQEYALSWERDPPDYAGDLSVAYTLGEEMRKRGKIEQFTGCLWDIVGPKDYFGEAKGWCWECLSSDPGSTYYPGYIMAHASAYDRALAAYRVLGGEG